MQLEKQLIMIIGMTQNNLDLTKEMVENSLDSFAHVPIVWNKQQEFKDYREENIENYKNEIAIGIICEEPNIIIEGNNVYADIFIFPQYKDLWKGKFDNWSIQFNEDRTKFTLCSIEVF